MQATIRRRFKSCIRSRTGCRGLRSAFRNGLGFSREASQRPSKALSASGRADIRGKGFASILGHPGATSGHVRPCACHWQKLRCHRSMTAMSGLPVKQDFQIPVNCVGVRLGVARACAVYWGGIAMPKRKSCFARVSTRGLSGRGKRLRGTRPSQRVTLHAPSPPRRRTRPPSTTEGRQRSCCSRARERTGSIRPPA